MDHLNFFESWGRWKFTKEAEERLNQINRISGNDEIVNNCKSSLEKLIIQLLRTENSKEDEEEEYFTDSSISTEVDDGEWEELKKIKKSTNREDPTEISQESREVKSDELELIVDESNDKTVVKKQHATSMHELTLNFTQTQLIDDEVYENDVIYSLKEALLNEETDDEEILTRIESNQINEEQLLELWSQLEESNHRLKLCGILACDNSKTIFLCKKLLLPWLSVESLDQPNIIVQKISDELPKFPNVAVKNLIVPLINHKDATLFKDDVFLIRDLMSQLKAPIWNLFLQGILENIKIEKWHLPLFKLSLESIKDGGLSVANISRLLIVLKASSDVFTNDREFGLLLMALVNSIMKNTGVSENLVEQLKSICENYGGSMKFKILNLLKQISKR